ncbi:sodium:proton antiporter [Actinoplanes sp. NPDC049596]|uniref:cation:proton antiporter n=1 Tax=unclassified Actinoplanes TaxID=2626549 RepID=UPI003447BFD8
MNGVQILLIIGCGIAVSSLARRRGVEPGWIIVVLAAAASFIPGVPRLELESEVILALVVPPLLYSATRGASFSSFGANLRPIINLGVILVVLTAGVLGYVTSWILPTIGLAAAFVLGSVLAPPDTITTVSHGEQMGLPRRATSVLTGESLVNDATALTLFAIAVGAVNGEHATFGSGLLDFFRNASLGILIGAALSSAALLLRKRLRNPTLETTLVLLVPFTAFLLAEEVHASGILAVVAAAFAITLNISLDPNFQYPGGYRTRLQENNVWPVLDFLLETFVFAYIGLQLKFVLEDLAREDDPGLVRTLIAAGVLLVVAILFRLLGVFVLFERYRRRHARLRRKIKEDVYFRARWQQREEEMRRRGSKVQEPMTHKEMLLVGWTGMRGILTLAAAAGIPEHTASGAPFPGRDALQAIALIVTLGTLLIQGTTVGWLARRLKFDVTAEQAEERADRAAAERIVAEAAAQPAADLDASFDAQRLALATAVRDHKVDQDVAREIIDELDLRQAARHTAGEKPA